MSDAQSQSTSIWMHATPHRGIGYASLAGEVSADVAIVGGGITGLMTAARLAEEGLQVVLLEADFIAGRNTGLSTGNLYAPVSGLAQLVGKWGVDVARQVVALRAQAMDDIERVASQFGIECGLHRVPMFQGVEGDTAKDLEELEQEFQAHVDVGLAPQRGTAGAVATTQGFSIAGQAQFNPFVFVQRLASHLADRVCIFENSAVIDIDADKGELETARGRVRARHVVLATHSPAGFNLLQAEMEAYREYGIALPVSRSVPPGIHWLKDAGCSVRAGDATLEGEWLVLVGEKHKTGEWDPDADYIGRLSRYAGERFAVVGEGVWWSAQQFRPADLLPYIGKSAHENIWLATGFQADGLTWGSVAARIIADGIQDKVDKDADLFDPRRFTPVKSAKGWASTNATVMKHMVGDRMKTRERFDPDALAPGQGQVVEVEGEGKVAVCRTDDGRLHAVSPVCPHMKCLVQWNGDERSWDCPCHGSRFSASGELLEGPAMSGLEPRELTLATRSSS